MNLLYTFWFAVIASLPAATGFAQVAVPPAQQATVKNGTIKGRVVGADTGLGLTKATVTLFGQGSDRSEPRVVRTNANGDYEVSAVKPGRYSVSASRSGYVTQSYGQKSTELYPERSGPILHLREGETLIDIDFSLVRGGAIEGRIVDATGEPLARSYVQLSRYRTFEGKRRLEGAAVRSRAETDDRGHFRLFEIPPGSYYLSARRSSFLATAEGDRTATPPTYYPGVLEPQDATRIEVGPGAEIQGVELALLEVRGFDIAGRVVVPEGKLDRDLNVWARPFGSDGSLGFGGVHGSVDLNGRFTLRNAIPGRYLITVRSDEFSPKTLQSGVLSGRAEVEVSESDVVGVVIVAGKGGEISGGIVWPSDSPSVDPRTISVLVSPDVNLEGLYPAQMGAAGRDWSFNLKGIGEGSMRLRIDLPPGPQYVKSIRVDGKDATDQTFDVHHNDRLQAVVIVSANGAEVNGTVKTEDPEAPAKGVTVLALAAEVELRSRPRFRRSTQTDQEGRYSLRGLVPGEYLLVAVAHLESLGEADPDWQKKLEKIATRVELAAGQTKSETLTLMSTGTPP